MNFGLPIALSTVAWTAAAVTALTVAAYVIKMRRRRFEVPFSHLWQRVLDVRDANALWRHLRRFFSLLLALAIAGLLLLAVLSPSLGGLDRSARNVVILLDASASMKTEDVAGKSRFDAAKQKAKDLVDALGGGDRAMVIRVDGQATPLSRFSDDGPMLRKAIDGAKASDTGADLRRALGAAADALRQRPHPMIVIVSDGAFPEAQLAQVRWGDPAKPAPAAASSGEAATPASTLSEIDLGGIDVRFLPVGAQRDNVGIVAFSARRFLANREAFEVLVEVVNFSDAPARRKLTLYSGDTALDSLDLALEPGQRLRKLWKSSGRDQRLRALLRPVDGAGGSDRFRLDDEAFALLSERKRQRVLLVAKENLYLEGAALALADLLEAESLTPEEYEKNPDKAAGYDAVIFDDHTPTTPPATNAIYFHPAGPASPVAVRGQLARPRVTEVDEEHPVMRWVSLSDANFDTSEVFAPDRTRGETWLALAVRDPIAVAKRDGRTKSVAFGFSLASTDLTLRVAFPMLLVNALDWFAGDSAELVTTYATGERHRVPLDVATAAREAKLTEPDGQIRPAPVDDGVASFYASQVGFYRLDGEGGAGIELAANLASPVESKIAPSPQLALGGRALTPPSGFATSRRQTIWIYLVLVVLVLLAVEWLTYHRRITV